MLSLRCLYFSKFDFVLFTFTIIIIAFFIDSKHWQRKNCKICSKTNNCTILQMFINQSKSQIYSYFCNKNNKKNTHTYTTTKTFNNTLDYSTWATETDYFEYCERVWLSKNLSDCCDGASFLTPAPTSSSHAGTSTTNSWFDENVDWIVPIIVILAILLLAFVARLFYKRKRHHSLISGKSGKKVSKKKYVSHNGSKLGMKPSRKKSDKTEKDSLLYGDF